MFELPQHSKHMLTRNQHLQMDHFERFMTKIIEDEKHDDEFTRPDLYEG